MIEGQFCGLASLAIVNRELAKALLKIGVDLRVCAVDLAHEGGAEIEKAGLSSLLVSGVSSSDKFDLHLRNAWPPVTSGMVGKRNGLVCWAWEESEIPALMADRFNRDLDVIMTTASYVSDALRRSGVTIPCPVVGNGADHTPQPRSHKKGRRKQILHISTCLPRKAPDALVRAYVKAFQGRDDVELYIKTSPNPHNNIAQIVEDARRSVASSPEIIIDERRLSPADMADLYGRANALVLVSKGEGFGLPLAEAMFMGVPTVAARRGAQADFCTDKTSFLVESRPARSLSHVAATYGMWEEPDEDSLGAMMKHAVDDAGKARSVVEAARVKAHDQLTWASVAERVVASANATSASVVKPAAFEIVSTWNEPCGIATYSEQFYETEPLAASASKIWARASKVAPPANEDDPRVARLWGNDGASMERFAAALRQPTGARSLWFQHHPGYFSNADMHKLLPALRQGRERLIVTLHNVRDTIEHPGADWLKGFDSVITHSADDAEALGKSGVRAEVLPHGLRVLGRPLTPSDGKFVVGSFGFLTEHKNIELLVAAVAQARRSDDRIRLVLANSVRPEKQSYAAQARVEALIAHYELNDVVTRDYSFLPDADVIDMLAECDLLAFLYGSSTESASGAARMGISLDRPMLLTRSEVFRDLLKFNHVVSRLDVETVAEAILTLANDRFVRELHDRQRRHFAESHSWPVIAARAAAILTN